MRATTSQTGILGVAAGVDTSRLTPAGLPFYTTASGTSFSAPQVAGAIALMLETNPTLTPAQVKDILQNTATPLPPYYRHEVGAGMLNVHAAVLQSAFPAREMGFFRSILDRKAVKFTTSIVQTFSGMAAPGLPLETNVTFPSDTVQGTVNIAWGNLFTPNDLGLKLLDANGLRGESNYLNTPSFSGKREQVTLGELSNGTFRAVVNHTAGIGTNQQIFGSVQATRTQIAPLVAVQNLSPQMQSVIRESLRSFVMLPDGKRFRPMFAVSRGELVTALLLGGRVPQYLAANPIFADVCDLTTRNAVEGVQKSPNGKLIFDSSNTAFRPDESATRLVTAVALVKAANLQNLTYSATLPVTLADAAQIPNEWRGYVAVALQKGFLTLDGNSFAPNRALKRFELAQAMVGLSRLAVE